MSLTRVKRIQKLLPNEEIEIAKIIEGKFSEVDERLKKGLPLINCECGAEILVVPDLQAMNRAIKTHVAQHRKRERNAEKNVIMSSKISQLLSQLTLIKISQRNDT
jgi:hypothetical protein